MKKHEICVAYGDGIGPEIMGATMEVIKALDLNINFHQVEMGEKVFESGISSGISKEAWDLINKYPVLLKAPITTPQGKGYKSLNVTLRKTLGLYANVRRSLSYDPIVPCKFPNMDVVIFRENEEDLYAGIEHRQTQEVYQCLKLTTEPGSRKIIRDAFEYAVAQGRKKVTCFSKDNIMKLTDGLFHRVFDEIAKDYPQIESNHMIIDIGAAKLATDPENFDVIVCQNLYGDILSDISAELSGSVGLAGSSNIGAQYSMFEAIHGSAPDIAGKGIANPIGLMLAAVEMINFIGESEKSLQMHEAVLKTLEDGFMTGDLASKSQKATLCSTKEFTQKVIANLGQKPLKLKHAQLFNKSDSKVEIKPAKKQTKELVGVDVFVDEDNRNPSVLAEQLIGASNDLDLKLTMITNRGVMVWPRYNPATFCTDHWRCRFESASGKRVSHEMVAQLLAKLATAKVDFIKSEGLYTFDGVPGFSLGQGQ
jgi:isocitrate dehydrogenase